MLHTPGSLRRFTKKDIADATRTTEVLLALQLDSKEAVNAMMDKVLAAGGKEAREPGDHGFMFESSFEDPDGHIWVPFVIVSSAIPACGVDIQDTHTV